MTEQLTRQALFELIWETPMKRLANDYNITPQALSALCDAFQIPKPGYGYWTLREMGRYVEKPALESASRALDEPITIEPRVRRTPKPTSFKNKRGASSVATSEVTVETAKVTQDESSEIGAQPIAPLRIPIGAAGRKDQILALLERALQARGWSAKLLKPPYKLVVDGEPLSFEITEQNDRVAHENTEREAAALRKFEAERLQAVRTGRYFSEWDRPNIPHWDYLPNGKLTLKFDPGYHHHGLRRSFSDGKRQRLDEQIDRVVESFAAYAQGEKDWRDEQEGQRLKFVEDEKRRRELDRRRLLETKRLEFLTLQIERHEAAARIEAFVAAYPKDSFRDEKVTALLSWAAFKAERIRAQLEVEVLREKLDRNDLMNDQAEVSSWREVE